jgi:hypothetical protein
MLNAAVSYSRSVASAATRIVRLGAVDRAAAQRLMRSRPRRDRIALRPATPSTASVASEIVAMHS